MKQTMTHLTMNTGDTRESARAEVADDVIAALTPLVRAGGGAVPRLSPYTVAITREAAGVISGRLALEVPRRGG